MGTKRRWQTRWEGRWSDETWRVRDEEGNAVDYGVGAGWANGGVGQGWCLFMERLEADNSGLIGSTAYRGCERRHLGANKGVDAVKSLSAFRSDA